MRCWALLRRCESEEEKVPFVFYGRLSQVAPLETLSFVHFLNSEMAFLLGKEISFFSPSV